MKLKRHIPSIFSIFILLSFSAATAAQTAPDVTYIRKDETDAHKKAANSKSQKSQKSDASKASPTLKPPAQKNELPAPETTSLDEDDPTSALIGGSIGCGAASGIFALAGGAAYLIGGTLTFSGLLSDDSCGSAFGLVFGFILTVFAGGILMFINGILAPLGTLIGVAVVDHSNEKSNRNTFMSASWGFIPGIIGGLIAISPFLLLPYSQTLTTDISKLTFAGGAGVSLFGAIIAATSGFVAIYAATRPQEQAPIPEQTSVKLHTFSRKNKYSTLHQTISKNATITMEY